MLNDQIKCTRIRLGISQSELARRSGYSHEFISQVERGIKSPSIKALQNIARGLCVSPSLLMETKHESTEPEEKLITELHDLIAELSIDKLKVIRDLLYIFRDQQNSALINGKFVVLDK